MNIAFHIPIWVIRLVAVPLIVAVCGLAVIGWKVLDSYWNPRGGLF